MAFKIACQIIHANDELSRNICLTKTHVVSHPIIIGLDDGIF